ncbi:MAG: hypothetical protein WBC83_03265 [Minisyncoccia bacterium]
MSRGSERETAEETGCSVKEARASEHDARNHATDAGLFERGNSSKNRERFSRDDSSGKSAGGFWSSIFGK